MANLFMRVFTLAIIFWISCYKGESLVLQHHISDLLTHLLQANFACNQSLFLCEKSHFAKHRILGWGVFVTDILNISLYFHVCMIPNMLHLFVIA